MKESFFVYQDNHILYDPDEISRIYNHMYDYESGIKWLNRILYSETLDLRFIKELVLSNEEGRIFEELLAKSKCYIYGAGKRGRQLAEMFSNVKWAGFIDSKMEGSYQGVPIIRSIKEDSSRDCIIIVSNKIGYKNIKNDLIQGGIKAENIVLLEEINTRISKNQYFDSKLLSPDSISGGFIDGGMYDGEDIIKYTSWNKKSRKWMIWGCEPDKEMFERAKLRFNRDRVHLICKGLSDKSEILFSSKNNEMTYLGTKGKDSTETTTIDKMCAGEKVGYIKLDIEGFEEKALRGAEETIRDQHPKIAVCLYHKRNDAYIIPKLLLDFFPGYTFSIGHYSLAQVDTVLYAF